MIRVFIQDENGAVTVDYVVFLGGVVWMGMTIVGDVARATMHLTDRVNERTSYELIISEIQQSYSSGVAPVADDTGDQGGNDNGDEPDDDGDSGSSDEGLGNPGNDKNVGRAGENPNGKGGWGNGSKGRSE
ncbi:hypothetical protein [Sinisalibacter lacisalsi]|uniref:Uncharacterized protein n=1 Tax=Sinisalibacter lacisalsi TaxID=1526570 RepID=A0ABQ1QXH1_9RHOB|nr:hypothetical protein [Sinisalibacter lacisalsi]GGD47093.1 hypothetical protein GCM10011358_33580 [Sinisalibacter lacisalsi]